MIHLTETGFHAGRRLCLSDRNDGERNAHASHAPLNLADFRAQCCPDCLRVWALEAYEDGDTMPQWVESTREKVNQ